MAKVKIVRATTVPLSLYMFCKDMLRELSEKYEVIGLSSPGWELDAVAEREGVKVIPVPMERRISIVKDCKTLCKIWRVFCKEKPIMVHSMTPKAGLMCMMAGMFARVPVRVHTFTGLVFPTATGLKRKILLFTDWLTCACATHIIPEGEGVKNDLLNNKVTKKPLKVLGYGNIRGVDLNFCSRRPKVMDIVAKKAMKSENVFTFLFVGRIVGDKGINELCSAFCRLHSQYPDTRLWLVGDFEDNLDPVSDKTKELINNRSNCIETHSWMNGDELLACYAGADCYVHPSYREGFPNTVLEAGAMGLPSIVTDINGSREIIIEGQNGTIVPPKSEQALYDAMCRMINDVTWRETMASNARKMIADRFEQSYVRKCLYDFYDEILKDKGLA